MVTSDSDRVQAPAPAFERQTAPPPQPAVEATTERPEIREPIAAAVRDPLWFLSLVVSGATIAAVGGLSTVVLSVLGLSGVLPTYMLPVGGIALGAAFLMLGTMGMVWGRMFRLAPREVSRGRLMFSSGATAVLIAGVAAIVLNILTLAFPGDIRYVAAAVIALGLGFLWHSGGMRRVSRFAHDVAFEHTPEYRPSGPFAINALTMAPVRDLLVGLGGMVLGVLAILNIAPVVLAFVALLIIGASLTFSASTICGATLISLKGICVRA
jgi:hypothetical protein